MMAVWALVVPPINWLTFKSKLPWKLKLIYPKYNKFALLRKVPLIQGRVKTDTQKCVTVKISTGKQGKHQVVVTHIELLERHAPRNVNVVKVRENAEISYGWINLLSQLLYKSNFILKRILLLHECYKRVSFQWPQQYSRATSASVYQMLKLTVIYLLDKDKLIFHGY